MSRLRYNWQAAVDHFRSRCPELTDFINRFGRERLHLREEAEPFPALSRAIAYQQLSGKAAATIHGRFADLFPDRRPDADLAAALSLEQLRAVGLSRAKALSILDLADKTRSGQLPGAARLGRLGDQEVTDRLCTVRGIGPWTAQMYQIFNLGRPDVMPATDLGIQKGVGLVYGMESLPDSRAVLERTRHLAPYRSAASWYFWRAAETEF